MNTMIDRVAEIIREVEDCTLQPKLFSRVLSGYSGEKIISLLQNLIKSRDEQRECYVEIGVFQGLTLLSNAAANPSALCIGIDNFSQYDPGGKNLSLVQSRQQALDVKNVALIIDDFESAFVPSIPDLFLGKKIGVYFIDGPHDYRSQMLCLLLAKPFLARNSVIVIDDCNYPHVRQATADFIASEPEFKLLFEAYTRCHPGNMNKAEEVAARASWWNGVNVLMHDPDGMLPKAAVSVAPSRELFYQDHIVHAARGAHMATAAMAFADALVLRQRYALRAGWHLLNAARRDRRSMKKRFAGLNTYSSNLPQARLIEPL